MRIVLLSDTHNLHDRIADIPPGDVLVHAGDMTGRGMLDEGARFLDWFAGHPHLTRSSSRRDRLPSLGALRLHAFGHIHEAYGTVERGGVTFVNACICDAQYAPVNPPVAIDL